VIDMPTNNVRVLVVDDSAVIRKAVKCAIELDPGITVVATANDGVHALDILREEHIDIVVSDLEMPHMDGTQLCQKMAVMYPGIPVIVLSGAASSSRATVAALAAGAVDYVSKPTGANVANVMEDLRSNLVPKIKTHTARKARKTNGVLEASKTPNTNVTPREMLLPRKNGKVSAVCVAVSTGGPQALSRVLESIPKSFPVPILVVQHMPATFTSLLADRLDTLCHLRVREAKDGDEVVPGGVWIAPGGRHMTVERRDGSVYIKLNDNPPEQSCRPAADVLFRSMPSVWGREVLAVVLTGMGADGTAGCKSVVEAGGSVIAQDTETSVVWGMPGSAVRAGVVETVIPLEEIHQEIEQRVKNGRLR